MSPMPYYCTTKTRFILRIYTHQLPGHFRLSGHPSSRTCDRKVAGSTPGQGAIKSTRSTQPSIPPGWLNRVPACMAGVRRGVFTVGWQVTLCDPIWQVTSRSSEMAFPGRAISAFTFTFFLWSSNSYAVWCDVLRQPLPVYWMPNLLFNGLVLD